MKISATHNIHMSSAVEQLCKGQDFAIHGKTECAFGPHAGANLDYSCVMDGHGTDACIRALRAISSQQWEYFMGIEDPISELQKHLIGTGAVPFGVRSGATCCLVRCFPSHVEVLNAGDSQCVIFKNSLPVFISAEHNCSNPQEIVRLKEQGKLVRIDSSPDLRMIGPRRLIGVMSQYAMFRMGLQLGPTQALGHNNATGIFPDCSIIPYMEGDSVRCIVGSDGLFDMCQKNEFKDESKDGLVDSVFSGGCAETKESDTPTFGGYALSDLQWMQDKSCKDICLRSVQRWQQVWDMSNNGLSSTQALSASNYDDVAVCVMDIVPRVLGE
jgi:serine/threonine protein phosphatase PrpC